MAISNLTCVLTFHLLVCLINGYAVLKSNGYEEFVVAIHPDVLENSTLIDKIKETMTEASDYLYKATRRAFFRNISILVPPTWSNTRTQRRTFETFEKAEIRIDDSPGSPDRCPYTMNYALCGRRGKYIHLTSDSLMISSAVSDCAPTERSIVHEWGHLHWGLFDEYDIQPFYTSPSGSLEFVRCSEDIPWKMLDCSLKGCKLKPCQVNDQTGLPEDTCIPVAKETSTTHVSIMSHYRISGVNDFCNASTHNTKAPNNQNRLCNLRSSWEVMLSTDDFANDRNKPRAISSTVPHFNLVQSFPRVIILVIDNSGSMYKESRFLKMKQATEIFIMNGVHTGTFMAISHFNSIALDKTGLVQITDKARRIILVDNLPKISEGETNICRGIQKGLQIASTDDGVAWGDELVVLTDGEDSTLSSCYDQVVSSGSVIHTVVLDSRIETNLEMLTILTGGLSFSVSDSSDSTGFIDAMIAIADARETKEDHVIMLESVSASIPADEWLNGTVSIDSTVGRDTAFTITWVCLYLNIIPEKYIFDPHGNPIKANFTRNDDFCSSRLDILGPLEAGEWRYAIHNPNISKQVISVAVLTHNRDNSKEPIKLVAEASEDSVIWPKHVTLYAALRQGYKAVVGAEVVAYVSTPNGTTVTLAMWDNAAGDDLFSGDGVYSRRFVRFDMSGRYNLKVTAKGNGMTRISSSHNTRHQRTPPILDENDKIQGTMKPIPPLELLAVERFSRVHHGGVFHVTMPENTSQDDSLKRITDLSVLSLNNDIINLTWTSPGGNVAYYQLNMNMDIDHLKAGIQDPNFAPPNVIKGDLNKPSPSGELEQIDVELPVTKNSSQILFIAIKPYDGSNHETEMSNIVQVARPSPTSLSISATTTMVTQLPQLEVSNIISGRVLAVIIVCSSLTLCVCLCCIFGAALRRRWRRRDRSEESRLI
uniref:calcium-activated chloride channel regulator 1-like n=1 Tax=Myxine glutinosa TaxID=7769 RepID=UPI00358FBD7A